MTYTDAVKGVLQCFAGVSHATVHLTGRSLSGFGEQHVLLPQHRLADGLPVRVLEDLTQGWSYRLLPAASHFDRRPTALPWLFAYWHLPYAFDGTLRRDLVPDAAVALVDRALARMPKPSVAVVAGPERWCAWRLVRPITDSGQMEGELVRLAQGLGADVAPARALQAASLPLAGSVRSCLTADIIEIAEATPSRRYALADLHPSEDIDHADNRRTERGRTGVGSGQTVERRRPSRSRVAH
jgi:hypothetical protein